MQQELATHIPSMGVTLFFTGLLVMMVLSLALEEKIHAQKSLIVGVFAVISLFVASYLGLMPFGALTLPNGHTLEMPIYIEAVNWEVIAIIIGSSLFVDVTSRSGLFSWVAVKLTKVSKGDPLILLWFYGSLTVIFSAVLNNVTAMIIIGSLTAVSLAKLKQNHFLLGFLLIEGLLTNIGGLLTLISSVPNIIVGNAAGIGFIDFFIKASPYVVVATILTLSMGAWLFKIKSLKTPEQKSEAAYLVRSFDEKDGIQSQLFFISSSIILVCFILVIATTSVTPILQDLGMGFVAMSFAVLMLSRYKSDVGQFYKAVDWDLILFFMALFVVINVMEHARVLDLIGQGVEWLIGTDETKMGTGLLLLSSALFSSVTDNIPLAAMLSKILGSMATNADSVRWWAVIFGANLGGNITPIGSASTLVAVTIIHKYKLKLSFSGFVKLALPYAIMQILLAAVYVLFFL